MYDNKMVGIRSTECCEGLELRPMQESSELLEGQLVQPAMLHGLSTWHSLLRRANSQFWTHYFRSSIIRNVDVLTLSSDQRHSRS